MKHLKNGQSKQFWQLLKSSLAIRENIFTIGLVEVIHFLPNCKTEWTEWKQIEMWDFWDIG